MREIKRIVVAELYEEAVKEGNKSQYHQQEAGKTPTDDVVYGIHYFGSEGCWNYAAV